MQKVKTEDQTLDAVWMPIRTGTLPRRPGGVCGQLAETQPTRDPVMRVLRAVKKKKPKKYGAVRVVLEGGATRLGTALAGVKSWGRFRTFGLVGEFGRIGGGS